MTLSPFCCKLEGNAESFFQIYVDIDFLIMSQSYVYIKEDIREINRARFFS